MVGADGFERLSHCDGVRRKFGFSTCAKAVLLPKIYDMVPTVQTPTDNLYKFLSFTGLVLSIICIGYPLVKVDALNLEILRNNGQIAQLEIERNALNSEIEDWTKRANQVQGAILDFNKGSKLVALNQEMDHIKSQKVQYLLKAEQVKTEQSENELLKQQLKRWEAFSTVGAFIGSILTILGFFCWYFRLQKPQDAAIAKEAQGK